MCIKLNPQIERNQNQTSKIPQNVPNTKLIEARQAKVWKGKNHVSREIINKHEINQLSVQQPRVELDRNHLKALK